jgi:replicative DNA helicase
MSLSNLEAEQAFLGALLANNGVLALCTIEPDDFSEAVHARIFEASASVIRSGRIATAVTLKNIFEADATLAEIGGTQYLARLAASATTIVNAPDYAKTIQDMAIRRRAFEILQSATADIESLPFDVNGSQFTADLALRFSQLVPDDAQTRFTLKQAMLGAVEQTAVAYQNKGVRPDAAPTGIKALDGIVGGLVAETLVVLAGRPSMGKTSAAAVLAYNAARNGKRVDFYSLDMTVQNLGQRLASIEHRVPYERMQWGHVSESEFTKLTDAANSIATLPLSIVARAGMTLTQLGAEIARSKMRNPDLALVFIDQLSQVHIGGKFIGQRMAEVTAITSALKALAIRYKVCIVLLHQLSRAADAREGNRPQLSDLRDSGSLEQDANVVIFPFREEYYLTRTEPKEGTPAHAEWADALRLTKDTMEIIVAKNSMGRIGSAKVKCDLSINEIVDLDDHTVDMF